MTDYSGDIAITGMGCVFADAPDIDAFWANILAGRESFSEIPSDRWHNELFFSEKRRSADKSYVTKGGFIKNVRDFAAMHFGIAPRRVQVMDPQHRLLYHTVRAALQDAGLETADWESATWDADANVDPSKMGVFLGLSSSEYRDLLATRTTAIEMLSGGWGKAPSPAARAELLASVENISPISAFSMPGSLLNMAAANIAHQWGMRGPAYTIDAACASALVAVYDAIVFLRAGVCDSAVAGGVYLNLSPINLVSFSRIGAISAQGRCRPFDANADGFLQGDGCGIVVLKRLEDALSAGDRVHAVIKGVGINNDGNTSSGPMAPSHTGQLEAIQQAYRDGGVDPGSVGFVECHGTATPVGDPTEVAALRSAMDGADQKQDQVWLSSVKANIGHTMSAAGIAGLIKAVLVVENNTIPPQAAFETPNERLPLEGTPNFAIANEPRAWVSETPRRAAISSFGFGGTNCHVVIEEAGTSSPAARDAQAEGAHDVRSNQDHTDGFELFVLTAPTRALLAEHARAVAESVENGAAQHASLADIAFTLNVTRTLERHRLVAVVDTRASLGQTLREGADRLAGDAALPALLSPSMFYLDGDTDVVAPRIAFCFPGQGAQRIGLMRELYDASPLFRARLDALETAVDGLLPRPLLAYLYPTLDGQDATREAAESALTATEVCQPAMAALGLALHGFLGDLGVQPHVTLGHSLGEFVACAAGGVVEPAYAMRFVARRGAAMAALELEDFGAMAAILAPRESIAGDVGATDGVVMANFNSPRQTVISGSTRGIAQAVASFTDKGVAAKTLRVSHAFHSPLVAGVATPIAELVAELEFQAPSTPVASAITCQPYTADTAVTRQTWIEHATSPVDFMGAIEVAAAAGAEVFLECGAGKTLATFARGTLGRKTPTVLLSPPKPDRLEGLHRALGQLIALGQDIDFRALYHGSGRRVTSLPLTPLVTEPYWAVDTDRAVSLTPSNIEVPASQSDSGAGDTVMASNPSDDLVALFREQNAILQQHAAILAQQTALLGGAPLPVVALPAGLPTGTATVASPDATVAVAPAAPAPAAAVAVPAAQAGDPEPAKAQIDVAARILKAVADVSAFPTDSLRQDQKLASDLGFDSLMFVELGTKIEGAFPDFDGGIPQSLLSETTTIGDIVAHLEAEVGRAETSEPATTKVTEARDISLYRPVAVERPRSQLPGRPMTASPVLVTRDSGGVGTLIASTLAARGATVVLAGVFEDHNVDLGNIRQIAWSGLAEDVPSLFAEMQADGVVPAAIIHAAGLDLRADLDAVLAGEAAPEPVAAAQQLAAVGQQLLGRPLDAFVSVTGMGGKLGLDDSAPDAVWQAGLVGFTKALAREWPDARVCAVDVNLQSSANALATDIVCELDSAETAVEVGLGHARTVITLEPFAAPSLSPVALDATSVVLVTGGAKGLGFKTASNLAARHKGIGLVLVGRSAATDSTVVESLQRLQSQGARVVYVQWDVSRPAPANLSEAVAKLGPIRGIVHAAGVLRDRRVADKTLDDLAVVVGVKVDGLLHSLRAVDRTALEFVAIYSSWSARYGNVSQTDYSAANELLNRLTGPLSGRLGLRVVSLLYPPWDDSEMARTIPGVVKRAMQAEGVPFLSDAEGLGALDSALSGYASGEWLVGSHVPIDERKMRATIPMSLESHPYVGDHRLKDTPVLPLASALDYVAAAADVAQGGDRPLVIDDLRLYSGIDLSEPMELGIELARTVWENGHAPESRIELRSLVEGGDSTLAYRARLGLGTDSVPDVVVPAESASGVWDAAALPMGLERFYAEHSFHGPLMRGIVSIDEVGVGHVRGVVKTSTPSDWISNPTRTAWTVDPMVVDAAFQLVAYWLWNRLGIVAFPTGFERFVLYAPLAGDTVRCVVVRQPSAPDTFLGSVQFQSMTGEVLAVMHHVSARILETATESGEVVAGGAVAESAVGTIDPKHWDISQFEEVKDLAQRLEMAEMIGIRNPYFHVHEGTARDTSVVSGRELVNYSSYNYLGFSGHPEVVAAAQDAIRQYGTSVSASRIASGERPLHQRLESTIANLVGVDDAIVMTAGHMTNETVIGHVFGEGDLIIHDMLAHNSIQQGAMMSGAKRRPFPHNDHEALDVLLTNLRPNFNKCVIIIEGVYSMDGDIPDLPAFIALKEKHQCLLFVDEAHSIGVVGKSGRGVAEYFGIDPRKVDFWMGTLSKSFASCGGYIAGSKALVEYLKYTAPAFVFSAGITPANAAAALKSMELMLAYPETVAELQDNSRFFLEALKRRGIDTGMSHDSAVVPCIVGNSFKCLQLSERLGERGINVQPIVYPAVEDNAARLRFFLSSTHSHAQLEETASIVREELDLLEVAPVSTL